MSMKNYVLFLSCNRGERGDHMQLFEGPMGEGRRTHEIPLRPHGIRAEGAGHPQGRGHRIEGWPMDALGLCPLFLRPIGPPLWDPLGGLQGSPELGGA